MRVNESNQSMDMESRDINYILPAYVRLYMFQTKNSDPKEIVFPMFESIPHPLKKGVNIPIRWVPDTSPEALEIITDGNNIPESTPESEAKADKTESDYNEMRKKLDDIAEENAKLKAQMEDSAKPLEAVKTEDKKSSESAIAGVDSDHQPSAARVSIAKDAPGGALPPGTVSDYGGSRMPGDLKQMAKDLAPEKDLDEAQEKPAGDIVDRAKGKSKKAKGE
jgi:regulator of replication initiation timing